MLAMDDNDNAGFLEMRGARYLHRQQARSGKGAAMNRPVKTTSRPQLALQSYLDSLLMEATEELPVEVQALAGNRRSCRSD